MSSSSPEPKYYLRAPGLEYNLNGPIQIGNIIEDMKHPEDHFAILKPMSEIVEGSGHAQGTNVHERHGSVNANFSAKLYQVFGGHAEAKGSTTVRTKYSYNKIQTLHLKRNPTAKDVKLLRSTDAEIDAALKHGPLYVVTGLKIAKGLKYLNERTVDTQGGVGGQGNVTEGLSVEGNLGAARGGEDKEEYKVIGDTIIAYRLHVIRQSSWIWNRGQEVKVGTYDPKAGGFMNRDKQAPSDDLEDKLVSEQDVSDFVQEQGYEGMTSEVFVEEDEVWTMLSIEEQA
ncbi:hypothetical protein IQ07DRAFT_599240 [Pyrenochaeta sp. DS3sAY3a]|nr:hypothetical protein IQ07DRAFT_599240 [Pyrenochaeta sp. DS3sAY3a]